MPKRAGNAKVTIQGIKDISIEFDSKVVFKVLHCAAGLILLFPALKINNMYYVTTAVV